MVKPSAIHPISNTTSYVHLCIAAKSGFGKTVFGGTAPRALFLTTDPEGTLSAARFGSTADEWKLNEWKDAEDSYTWLLKEGAKQYEWLIVDNITELQNLAKDMARDVAVKNKQKRGPYKYALDDYQIAQNAISETVLKLHALPINVLWTAHIKGLEDPDGNDFYSVAIQGKDGEVAEKILGYMNIIGMGEVVNTPKGDIRRIWFSHHDAWRGKDRFNVLGAYQDNMDIPKMMKIIKGAGRLNTTATAARRPSGTAARTTARTTATRTVAKRKVTSNA